MLWSRTGRDPVSFSVRDTTPSSSNLAYLEETEGKTTLKKNSDYYYQIQGQMAVTGRACRHRRCRHRRCLFGSQYNKIFTK